MTLSLLLSFPIDGAGRSLKFLWDICTRGAGLLGVTLFS
jgi:hypothetical protein